MSRSAEDVTPLSRMFTRSTQRTVVFSALVIGAAAWLWPVAHLIFTSLEFGGIGNYATVLTSEYNGVHLVRAFINTMVIAVLMASMTCLVGAMAGYAFSKLTFPGQRVLFFVSLLLLTVPATAILVPVYSITKSLGLFNNPLGVALPEVVLTLPFAVLMMKNAADGIPDDLIDAAKLDGAGSWRIFWHVFRPLAMPTTVNLAALCVVWSVQDFLFPTLLLTDTSAATAAQSVQTIKAAFGPTPAQQSEYYAALAMLALPAILVVLAGFRYLAQGLTSAAVKE